MVEQMKDSGIQWIGQIPHNWSASRLKFMLDNTPDSLKVGPFGSSLSGNDFILEGKWVFNQRTVLDNNFVDNDTCITEEKFKEMKAFSVFPGDILITTRGSTGKVSIVPQNAPEGILHPCIIKFRVDKNQFLPELLKLVFNETEYAQKQFAYMSNSTTIEVIYSYSLKDIVLPVIPICEQCRIYNFLDKECAQIDSIAADLEKQIELLQQYKKSLITETVTKGLDKSAPMKESGIEWVNQVPRHWKIKRFKYIFDYITDGSHFSPETVDEGYPYITAADVRGIGLDYESTKKITEKDYLNLKKTGCQPRMGDILLVKDGATTGRIGMAVSEKPCVVLSSVAILRVPLGMDYRYFYYLMGSDMVQAQIQVSMAGSAMPRTVLSKIVNYIGIVCPIGEQRQISDYLDEKCSNIDAIISTKNEQLSNLQSHKKSLIYEYVTGKKRVKEAQ